MRGLPGGRRLRARRGVRAGAHRAAGRRRAQRRVADRAGRRAGARGRALRGDARRAPARPGRRRRPSCPPSSWRAPPCGSPRSRSAEDIVRETVTAARALAGFESAMLALPDGDGGLYVHHAEGSFAVALSQLERHELAQIAGWVRNGTSSYTAADTGGRGFAGHEVLRAAGANSLIVLPLRAAGEDRGLLVLADRANLVDHDRRRRAARAARHPGGRQPAHGARPCSSCASAPSRDPLTGLGHHATFHTELPAARAVDARRTAAGAAARRRRRLQGHQRHPRPRGRRRGAARRRAHPARDRAAARRAPSGSAATSSRWSTSAPARRRPRASAGSCVRGRASSSARRSRSALAIAAAPRDARAARRARRRRHVRGQAPRPRRRAARAGSAGHDQRVGVGLDGHPLEPALADLAVHVELASRR